MTTIVMEIARRPSSEGIRVGCPVMLRAARGAAEILGTRIPINWTILWNEPSAARGIQVAICRLNMTTT